MLRARAHQLRAATLDCPYARRLLIRVICVTCGYRLPRTAPPGRLYHS
jgi:hypothetical protein